MKRLEIDFNGRTALITGAATGIGRAIALAFGLADPSCSGARGGRRPRALSCLASDLAGVITGAVYPIDGAPTDH